MNLSFIKLDINIMNDTKIKLIRKMPDGDSILALWIGVLCLAMKSGRPGIVEIGDGIPFTDESLSVEFDIELNTVRLGLKVFRDFKMIEIWEDGEIYISNFEKHQELTKIEKTKEISRESSKKHRNKMKQLTCVTVTQASHDGHDKKSDATDIEEDKEEDKDISDTNVSLVNEDSVDVICPHQKIIELWHSKCPQCPSIRRWGEPNKTNLKTRWRESKECQSLEWWGAFFDYMSLSDFLMGRKSDFVATLGWVVKRANFEKIINGNYENRGPNTGSERTDANIKTAMSWAERKKQQFKESGEFLE